MKDGRGRKERNKAARNSESKAGGVWRGSQQRQVRRVCTGRRRALRSTEIAGPLAGSSTPTENLATLQICRSPSCFAQFSTFCALLMLQSTAVESFVFSTPPPSVALKWKMV
ncbi:hypothetical protein MRX96_033845 [Rhipicephalus microplus]